MSPSKNNMQDYYIHMSCNWSVEHHIHVYNSKTLAFYVYNSRSKFALTYITIPNGVLKLGVPLDELATNHIVLFRFWESCVHHDCVCQYPHNFYPYCLSEEELFLFLSQQEFHCGRWEDRGFRDNEFLGPSLDFGIALQGASLLRGL